MIPLLLASLSGPAGAAELLELWDHSIDDGDFRSDGNKLQWEWGTVASGPDSGLNGAAAWATILAASYLQSADDTLQLDSLDLSSASRPVLQLDHWYELEDGADFGTLQYFSDGGWQLLEPIYGYPSTVGFTGSSEGWETHWFDLSGLSSTSSVRLRFESNETVPLAGWYLGATTAWDGDPVPPSLSDITVLEDSTALGQPFSVELTAEDDQGSVAVVLEWEVAGEERQAVEMTAEGAGLFSAELPAVDQPDLDVQWWVEATDGAGNSSSAGPFEFRVYLPAPSGLSGPEGRVIGSTAELGWIAPEAEDPVLGYMIYRDGLDLVAESDTTQATVPLVNSLHTFEVTALFDTVVGELEGDASEVLGVVATLPEIDPLSPAESWQGTVVRVSITGENLLLAEDEVSVDLGDGVSVLELDVVNADHLEVLLGLEENASTGLRDLTLTSGSVELIRGDAFQVLDGAWAPQLTAIEPSALEQGSHAMVEITANAPFASLPVVDLGAGIIIEEVQVGEDGQRISLELAVSNDAPLGEHPVILDDGVYLYDGVSLRVRDQTPTVDQTCGCAQPGASTARGQGLLGALLLAVLGLRRREP